MVDGLIPGWKYSADASVRRKVGADVMEQYLGELFEDVTIEPGENKDLGAINLVPEK